MTSADIHEKSWKAPTRLVDIQNGTTTWNSGQPVSQKVKYTDSRWYSSSTLKYLVNRIIVNMCPCKHFPNKVYKSSPQESHKLGTTQMSINREMGKETIVYSTCNGVLHATFQRQWNSIWIYLQITLSNGSRTPSPPYRTHCIILLIHNSRKSNLIYSNKIEESLPGDSRRGWKGMPEDCKGSWANFASDGLVHNLDFNGF